MQEAELNVVRVIYDALCRGDIDGLLEFVHDDIELHSYVEGAFRGHAELLEWFRNMDEAWDPWSVAVEAIVDAGPCAIVVTRLHGRSRASRITTELAFCVVCEVVDGKAAFVRHLLDVDAALAAARSPLHTARSASETEIRRATEILRRRDPSAPSHRGPRLVCD